MNRQHYKSAGCASTEEFFCMLWFLESSVYFSGQTTAPN